MGLLSYTAELLVCEILISFIHYIFASTCFFLVIKSGTITFEGNYIAFSDAILKQALSKILDVFPN